MPNCDVMPRSVLLDHHAVIHRNFCGAIVEIGRRIAPSRHDGPKQLIRFDESAGRIVDELGLDRAPRLLETVTICRGEGPEVITLYPLFNLLELSLRFKFIASFGDGPVVFRPEASHGVSWCDSAR